MNESIRILQSFLESFEQNINNGYIDESLLKNIESNKIKILLPLIQSSSPQSQETISIDYIKFIKNFISKIWNYCRMLNFVKNVKDNENNFALLRIKDFLCDLFFALFSNSSTEISIQDIFNLIQLVTEVGKSWSSIEMQKGVDGWIKKIETIMKNLLSKINEVEVLVNLDKQFYSNLFEYFNFYIEYYLINDKTDKSISEEINSLLFLVKNIKFIKNDNNTQCFITQIFKLVSKINDIDNQISIFESINSLVYKANLPSDLLLSLFKIYITLLIDKKDVIKAESVLKNSLEMIEPNTKDEIEFYILHLFILIQKKEDNIKLKEMIEIIFEHKELCMEDLEKVVVKIAKCNDAFYFIEIFCKKLSEMKNLKFSNSKIVFSFDNIKKYPNFTLIFLYIFFNVVIKQNESLLQSLSSQILNEFIKNLSESLLEHTLLNSYQTEDNNFEYLIPTLFHNIITFFLKFDNGTNDSFANYFLIEIIHKFKNSRFSFWKEFLNTSIDIYIEKKDFPKLKTILSEVEQEKTNFDSIYYYAKIILIIGEGLKWNSVNLISQLCLEMNSSKKCEIDNYIKIFNYLYLYNIQDVTLYATLMYNYAKKFEEMINNNTFTINKQYLPVENNKIFSLFDCFYEVLFFSCKMNNFPMQINSFCEIFELMSGMVENKKTNFEEGSKDKYLASSFSIVIDLIKLMIDLKNSKSFTNDSFPEFILISICKMLNFVFINFDLFISNEVLPNLNSCNNLRSKNNEVESGSKNKNDFQAHIDYLSPVISLFEIFQNLKIFYFTSEYENLISTKIEEDKQILFTNLYNKYKSYQQNLVSSYELLISIFSNHLVIKAHIQEKINNIFTTTKTVEQILNIQLTLKSNTCDSIKSFIFDILDQNYTNKKFIFIVNSLLFQNGMSKLFSEFLAELLNKILVANNAELFNKIYTIEDVLNIFKDYVSIIEEDSIELKIQIMKQYQIFLSKLYGKIDDKLLNENIEWIYYKVYQFFENKSKNVSFNGNDANFLLLKSIVEELNTLHIRNKPLIMTTLIDLIMKKLI